MTVYLNVYRVYQCYGGPEEGNWWFDAGEPLESTVISDESLEDFIESRAPEELQELRDFAVHKWTQGMPKTPRQTGYGGYTFMPGSDTPLTYEEDNNVRACFEDTFAEPYPQERPTYE
jgi:hypothetical protein